MSAFRKYCHASCINISYFLWEYNKKKSSTSTNYVWTYIFDTPKIHQPSLFLNNQSNMQTFTHHIDTRIYRLDLIKFARLRLDYTNVTLRYLLQNIPPQHCHFYNSPTVINIFHLLTDCPLFQTHRIRSFSRTHLLTLLPMPNTENILKIISLLKATWISDF